MPFTSYNFIFLFLPIIILLYNLFKKSTGNLFLLLANLLFVFYTGLQGFIIVVCSAISYYVFGLLIQSRKKKRIYFVLCLLINLGILIFFKYSINIVWRMNALLNTSFDQTKVIMPIGISFYTFQGIAYLSDVYKGKISAEKNITTFLTYQLFFPVITSGPILRYEAIKTQLIDRSFDFDLLYYGLVRFSVGLFKKMYLSNRFAWIANNHYALPSGDIFTGTAWIASIAFSLQIFLDFSGYSDMALGCAAMLGIKINENFNYPYISKSITEFWRRWHMSLSSWFRDYIYIPLGGNRVSSLRYLFNVSIVWLITGIWHGNTLNFVLWGMFNLLLILFERTAISKKISSKSKIFNHVYSLFMINIAWVLFRTDNISQASLFLKKMFVWDFNPIGIGQFTSMFSSFPIDWILAIVVCTPLLKSVYTYLSQKENPLINLALSLSVFIILAIGVIMVVSGSYQSFLYQNF